MTPDSSSAMTPIEKRSVAVLASIYGLRILGLFLILPVFTVFASTLEGQTPWLIGVAFGAYGLTQALLQIPFGGWSDRFGRKPVIVAGLLLFALGSVVAALANSITVMIIGRIIQGAGAIPAAVMALVADLTRDEQRLKAMASIGITIGGAFILSIMLGPVLGGAIGVRGIFWLTAIAAIAAIVILLVWVPTPTAPREQANVWQHLPAVMKDKELLRLNAGIFVLHLVLTALFAALPKAMITHLGLDIAQHWKLYLPSMLASLLTMVPFIIIANKKRRMREVMLGAIVVLASAQAALLFVHTSFMGVLLSLWLFFTAFNLLEAMLPSLVSRLAPPRIKGASIGVYSTSQFLGVFVGAVAGSKLYAVFGLEGVFLFAIVLLLGWFGIAYSMSEPVMFNSHTVPFSPDQAGRAEDLARVLTALPGVREAVVVAEEGVVHLKVDPRTFDAQRLKEFAL